MRWGLIGLGPKRFCAALFGLAGCLMSGAAYAQAGGPPVSGKPDKDAPLITSAPAPRAAPPRAQSGDKSGAESSESPRIGASLSAPKGILTAISAPELIAALADAGFPARWMSAPDGERILVGQLDDATPFQIVLQDCVSAQTSCVDFELSFGVNLAKPPSAEQINRWNRDKTWAAFAYLTPQGAPALRAQYTLAGGISAEHLRVLLKAWGASLRGFLAHIAYVPEGPRAATTKP